MSRLVLLLGLLLVGINLFAGTQGKALLQALGIKTPRGGPGVGGGGGGGEFTPLAVSLPPVSNQPTTPPAAPAGDFRSTGGPRYQ